MNADAVAPHAPFWEVPGNNLSFGENGVPMISKVSTSHFTAFWTIRIVSQSVFSSVTYPARTGTVTIHQPSGLFGGKV